MVGGSSTVVSCYEVIIVDGQTRDVRTETALAVERSFAELGPSHGVKGRWNLGGQR